MFLAAIALALLVPLIIVGLSFARRVRPGALWLLAVISALLSWGLVLLAYRQLPVEITLFGWEFTDLVNARLSLLLDAVSWPFALALITLPLAAILADVARLRDADVSVWASLLALGGVGLLAVTAGTPLTLLLAWTVIDVADVFVLLRSVKGSAARERVVAAFSARAAGMFFLVLAMLRAQSLGENLSFAAIPAEAGGYLLLAAGLRLGVFPPHQPALDLRGQRRGLGTMTRLLPAAASLVFVVRIANLGRAGELEGKLALALLALSALAALYGAWRWFWAEDVLQGRSDWVLGMAALALAAAIQGLPAASAAWGLAALFSGALLFLTSTATRRWMLVFPFLGAVGFSALPLTPAWEGAATFGALGWGGKIAFTLALALLFAGYLRHARRAAGEKRPLERWMWLVYPLGLGVLPLAQFGSVYLRWAGGGREITFQTAGWWFGAFPLGLAALLMVWSRRTAARGVPLLGAGKTISLEFIYRFFWGLYRLTGRFVTLLSRLLEGEGGILWALLILILTVVALSLTAAGGGVEL